MIEIAGVAIHAVDDAVVYAAGLQIDADGAPNAYHPPTPSRPNSGSPPGLDDLRNAGRPGQWWGIVARAGQPVVQGPGDPFPGYYVSTTALADHRRAVSDPLRYVDSTRVPYVSLPARLGVRMGLDPGDVGIALRAGADVAVIYADIGPQDKIGEGSIALAQALGVFRGVRVGHSTRDIVTVLFRRSRRLPPWPREPEEMRASATVRFAAWGGRARAAALYPALLGAA